MGNFFSSRLLTPVRTVTNFLSRFHPAEDSSDAELDAWSERLRLQIVRKGFETVFQDQIRDIAEVADTHPALLPAYVEKWMSADPEMVVYVEGHTSAELSQLDFKTGTRADGRTDRTIRPSDGVHGVVESDGKPVKVYREAEFTNWGSTVENTPAYTFVPKTEVGVVNIVKFAVKEGRRVRTGGTRHSWTDIYGRDGDVFISMVEPGVAVLSGRFDQPDPNPQDNELETVEFAGKFTGEDGKEYGKVRLGGAATSDHFRQWAVSQEGGNWEWMIRALPILVSITSSGWTQPICHGAGILNQSVSDLCVEMRIVNCKGELQTITDKDQLKAVAGGFGLLGVITSHVFVLDPMKIARLFPARIATPLAVPPVSRSDVPQQNDFDISQYSDEALAKATADFAADCNKSYSEWFWFPFQSDCWVNCWDTEDVGSDRSIYPDKFQVKLENLQAAAARMFEVTFLKFIPPEKQARLLAGAAMNFLPSGELLKTPVSEALHFRRGIHRMPVRDMELSLEIPLKTDGTPDFSICQKAWWDAISEVYETLPEVPMRTTLEMRVVGGSNTTLSTQRGNAGTCAIEVLTSTLVSDDEWNGFMDRMAARWAKLTNPTTNEPLRVKPHWAKEWPTKLREKPILEYLKHAYRNDIPEFKLQFAAAAAAGGYGAKEALSVFGNDTLVDILGVTLP